MVHAGGWVEATAISRRDGTLGFLSYPELDSPLGSLLAPLGPVPAFGVCSPSDH